MAAILQTTFSNEFFFNENLILIRIALKFIPKDPVNNKTAFAQILTWTRTVIIWTHGV